MTADLRDAHDYLLGRGYRWADGPLWNWADNGRVVCWIDGSTIAFREEVIPILERLSAGGLPPFGAILFLLAATRDSWPEGAFRLTRIGAPLEEMDAPSRNLIGSVLSGLHRVRALKEEIRRSPDAKAMLAEVVFEGCPVRTTDTLGEKATRLLRAGAEMDAGILTLSYGTAFLDSGASDPSPEELLRRDLKCLVAGLDRVDPKRLEMRAKTGLEEPPAPVPEELPTGEHVRCLLDELEDDAELAGLVRLTRDLMAALTLPRAVSEPDELPQGGVSDLTNRGDLDRLLLSELAHDDLTLAVRVATGSALYWRRERPPQPQPRMRSMLLESGLRSWGVPRVFATAVALAAAATVDKHTSPVCHRASGETVVPVDLTMRAGLVTHLSALTPEVHPGDALPAFLKSVENTAVDTDVVLVLGEEVYDDREFQRRLAETIQSPMLIATVNRVGGFRLLARGSRGTRILREATLNLESLFSTPPRRVKPLIAPDSTERPAILRVSPFPLRLTHVIDPKRLARIDNIGILTLTRDRRLMLWDSTGSGALQLMDNAPRGEMLWCSTTTTDGRAFAVVGNLGNAQLTLLEIRLDTDEVIAKPLPVQKRSYLAVCYHNGLLFAIHKHGVEAFDLLTGERRGQIETAPHRHWRRDRFFYDFRVGYHWLALSVGNGGPVFVHLPNITEPTSDRLSTFLDSSVVDAPIGVSYEGHLHNLATNQIIKVQHGLKPPVAVVGVSRRGDQILLSGRTVEDDKQELIRVKIATGDVTLCYADPFQALERPYDYVSNSTLRTRFLAITVDSVIGLRLIGRGARTFTILPDDKNDLRLNYYSPIEEWNSPISFDSVPSEGKHGFRLRKAEWPDGSRAFLDSRGLLHLQSSDRSIPEVTLVLRDGPLAGWCADGTVFGPYYFTGVRNDGAAVRHVWQTAIEPFVRRLP